MCSVGLSKGGRAQETLLIDKPLRLVGLPAQDVWGRARRGVVLQTGRPLAIMCNARCAPAAALPPHLLSLVAKCCHFTPLPNPCTSCSGVAVRTCLSAGIHLLRWLHSTCTQGLCIG